MSGAAPDLNSLVALEVLSHLRSQRKKGSASSSGADDGSEADARGSGLEGGNRKALAGVTALRRRFRRKPEKLSREYEKMAKRIIGVTDDRQVWGYRDVSKRLLRAFGKMRGLWRAHAGLQEIIQYLNDGDAEHALAYACQLSKALHQVGLDRGNWDTALLMIPTPDALSEPQFGGEEYELAAIQSYKKAIRELKARQLAGDHSDEDEDEDPNKTRKQKQKEKEKQKREKEKAAAAAAAAGGAAAK